MERTNSHLDALHNHLVLEELLVDAHGCCVRDPMFVLHLLVNCFTEDSKSIVDALDEEFLEVVAVLQVHVDVGQINHLDLVQHLFSRLVLPHLDWVRLCGLLVFGVRVGSPNTMTTLTRNQCVLNVSRACTAKLTTNAVVEVLGDKPVQSFEATC